jgi:hypothetical protein
MDYRQQYFQSERAGCGYDCRQNYGASGESRGEYGNKFENRKFNLDNIPRLN